MAFSSFHHHHQNITKATNGDPDKVSKTLGLVLVKANVVLQSLQEHAQVPADQMVTPFEVAPPSTPSPGMPSRTRSTAAIFLAGVGLSILLTVVLDVLLARFRVRRPTDSPLAESGASDEQPVIAHAETDGHLLEPAAAIPDGARQDT